jgi:hypothetical protein
MRYTGVNDTRLCQRPKQTTLPIAHSLIEKRERERITTIGLSLSTNKALVKSFVESVFNDHDLPAIEKYLAATLPLITLLVQIRV